MHQPSSPYLVRMHLVRAITGPGAFHRGKVKLNFTGDDPLLILRGFDSGDVVVT